MAEGVSRRGIAVNRIVIVLEPLGGGLTLMGLADVPEVRGALPSSAKSLMSVSIVHGRVAQTNIPVVSPNGGLSAGALADQAKVSCCKVAGAPVTGLVKPVAGSTVK